MSRIKVDSRLPQGYDAATLLTILREFAQQLNGLTEGSIVVVTNALTSIPTAGSYKQGDFVRKSNLAEAGAGGSKYVITGWLRLTNGSAHVLNTDWVEARVLTGN
jgi:hypothetical protein